MAEGQGASWERWFSLAGNIVAPATALSTLLFYFGYVSTRAQYLHFGLDVDTIGLSTQGFVMRSPQPLLVPLLLLSLLAAALVLLGRRFGPQLVGHSGALLASGLAIGLAGLALLLLYPALIDWAAYPLVTPLVLAVGTALAAWAMGLRHMAVRARVALWLVVATAVFWANATVAQWSGRGLAIEQAARLGELPRVVLDTRERLYLRGSDAVETVLPAEEGQVFRYRYRGWRLLVQNEDRMFLVSCRENVSPCAWRQGSPTLMVRIGDSTRVQFLPP